MICYGDTTFCEHYQECNPQCPRALTEEVKANAEKWWGGEGAPIAVFMRPCKCERDKKAQEITNADK